MDLDLDKLFIHARKDPTEQASGGQQLDHSDFFYTSWLKGSIWESTIWFQTLGLIVFYTELGQCRHLNTLKALGHMAKLGATPGTLRCRLTLIKNFVIFLKLLVKVWSNFLKHLRDLED